MAKCAITVKIIVSIAEKNHDSIVILKLFIQAAMLNPQVTLDSQLHRDYYTILHLPFFGSVNKSPNQRLTMN